ncbi:MAG: quinone oxidoreductase family protein [Solirubrobacteraceae bacterium]
MSRVVVATAYGGPEVLRVVDEPAGEPGPGELLLDVRSAGVNPVDWKRYSGVMGADPAQLPMRLGFEAAGIVAAAGPDATGPAGPVAVGDEVIAFRIAGAYAERVVIPTAAAVPKPANMPWEAAGGLMLAGATAVHLLTATGVGAGDCVLVHGASGGVGLMAVQIARARDARVIGTASPARHDALRALGAEPVAYGDGLVERVRALAGDGVDAALDVAGTDEAIDASLAPVADRERIATVVAFERGPREGIRLLGGGPGADGGEEVRNAARLELVRLVADGALQVAATPYPLDEAAEAHRLGIAGLPTASSCSFPRGRAGPAARTRHATTARRARGSTGARRRP